MIIITILQNFTKLIFWLINIFNFIKFLKTKQLKNIFLLILFYLFLNLYLFPTNALCEIDPNLLDRENNTYKGSKIVYETPDEIVTKKEVEDAQETMYIVQGVIIWFMFAGLSLVLGAMFPGNDPNADYDFPSKFVRGGK